MKYFRHHLISTKVTYEKPYSLFSSFLTDKKKCCNLLSIKQNDFSAIFIVYIYIYLIQYVFYCNESNFLRNNIKLVIT